MKYSIPCLVHFEQIYDLIKKIYFKKLFEIIFRINRKLPYEKLTFNLRKL